ncbi:DHH family phosphoesterase [bacterium]|nr:DHH family phosphoesterase [bacterium]
MNPLISKTFENRGYSLEYIYSINNPNYDKLKDIDLIASELKYIHDNQIPVTVFPDFDVDGISSGVLGFAGLAELGFKVNLFVPNASEGYGITVKSIQDLMIRFPDTKAIITCDTGIGAVEACEYCRNIGVKVLLTDHHIQKQIVDADVIVNPMRMDETYSHPAICGAFVLYQVLQHYSDLYCNYFTQDQIRRLRVFAGIGTISDTMPVLYENRQVVKDAISICKYIYGDGEIDAVANIPGCDVYRKAFYGLYYALKVCESYGVVTNSDKIDEDFFGFYYSPIFNSTKRMDGDMNRAFGVFFGNNPKSDADYLYNLNIERKLLVESEFKNIMASDQPYAPYFYIWGAKPGILGLLAMKLMNATGAPSFVMLDEVVDGEHLYHGSGRVPEWYDCSCIDGLVNREGHQHAFGCKCDGSNNLQEAYSVIKADYEKAVSEMGTIEPVYDFVIATDWSGDTGIDVGLFADYLEEIEMYRPFGKGFPAPHVKFVFTNNDVKSWTTMGKAKQHLKISFMSGFDVLCWNQAHLINMKNSTSEICVVGHLGTSVFQGQTSINFVGDLLY